MPSTTTEFDWAEPPPDHRSEKGGQYRGKRAAMKANPGKWMKVFSTVNHSSNMTPYKRDGFEAVSRKNANGKIDIYARWPEF